MKRFNYIFYVKFNIFRENPYIYGLISKICTSGNAGAKRAVENLNKLNKFRQLDVIVAYSSGEK